MIFITVKFPVKPEHADDWPSHVADFTAATRAEPGNLWFEWSRSLDDPNTYVLVEAFQDDAAAAHVNSDHFRAAMQTMPPLLARTPQIINTTIEGVTEWGTMGELSVD